MVAPDQAALTAKRVVALFGGCSQESQSNPSIFQERSGQLLVESASEASVARRAATRRARPRARPAARAHWTARTIVPGEQVFKAHSQPSLGREPETKGRRKTLPRR